MAEIVREFTYFKGEPILVVKAKNHRGNPTNFAIMLKDAWMYSRDHQGRNYDKFMYGICEQVHDLLDLGVLTTQKMAEIATIIEDGLADLLVMPPEPEGTSMKEAMEKAGIDVKIKELA